MYFLNGDRIFIKPEKACRTLDEQLQNCLLKLTKINAEQKIFKLNFFADTKTKSDYLKLQNKIRLQVKKLFPETVLQCLIAQPPLTCKIIIEACYYESSEWTANFILGDQNSSVIFRKGETEVLIGHTQSYANMGCKLNAEKAFAKMISIFYQARFPLNSIIRQWNYLENILGFDGEMQRYQEFNNIRTNVYGTAFKEKGYPAATGIGMNQGGIIIEFIALKSAELTTLPIDNPVQVAAHHYSEKVLIGEERATKCTPKFERARYLGLFGQKMIFISGTASIVGEKTVGAENPAEQTEVTIKNIKQLYSKEAIEKITNNTLNAKYGHARVYIKNRKDFPVIKRTFQSHFKNLPVVYILADICRNELLVEIEGKVVLE